MTWSRKARLGLGSAILFLVGGPLLIAGLVAGLSHRWRPMVPVADAWSGITGTPAPVALVDWELTVATLGRTVFDCVAVVGILVATCAAFVGIPLLFASVAEAIVPVPEPAADPSRQCPTFGSNAGKREGSDSWHCLADR